ncbi:MAG: xylulokinase [Anaerolineae bacterium]
MGEGSGTAPLVAGLDVGTNATKCLVCAADGRVVAQSRYDYTVQHPDEGWAEQDAEELWRAVLSALGDAVARAKGEGRVVALSLSSQGGTTIPVDDKGKPLRPAISWLDTRGGEEGQRLVAEVGQDLIYNSTGWEAGAYLPIAHIPWLREHEPNTYEQARRYLFVNDFVIQRLSGELCMDPSDAALTLLYNIENDTWDERLCRAAGVRLDQLSPIEESGRAVGKLLPAVAALVGLGLDVLVVNGGHDQYCAALGAAVTSPGDVLLSCGTAWVLLAVADRLLRDPRHTFAPGRHVVPGCWGLLCAMSAAGASMDWFARNLASAPEDGKPRYDLLDERIADPVPGARGLLFLPYMTGIEVATRGMDLWGTFTGLTLSHSRWDMAQSIMEGVALELRWVLERLQTLGAPPQLLHMVGGATRSRAWPQIVADATGIQLAVPDIAEAAARGAALLAAVGAKLYEHVDDALPTWRCRERRLSPRPQRTEVYTQLFEKFRSLDRALRQAL